VLFVGLNDDKRLLQAAENENHLCVWTTPSVEKREIKNKKREEQKAYLHKNIALVEQRKPFKLAQREEFCGGDINKILTEADKSRLFFVILDQIDLDKLPMTLEAQTKHASQHKRIGNETLMSFLKRIGVVKEVVPLFSKSKHVRAQSEGRSVKDRSDLMKQVRDKTRLFIDVSLIRSYYGDEVAIYFEWMQKFQKHLFWPGVFSIFVFIGNNTIYTSQNSPLSAIFSLMMCFWGIWFMISWSRHQMSLNILWDDFTTKANSYMHTRKEFYGDPIISQVTDRPDIHYSLKKRMPLYALSLAICLPCLMACIFVIICFLNCTGVIRPEHHGGIFNIAMLSHLADEGALFDPNSNMNMVAAIAQTITTMMINQQFRKVAQWTTDMENHKTQPAYDYSLFIKRFIFEFTDFQLYLFYIGIYQMHIGLLRTNLIALFATDEVRRVICEAVIPYI